MLPKDNKKGVIKSVYNISSCIMISKAIKFKGRKYAGIVLLNFKYLSVCGVGVPQSVLLNEDFPNLMKYFIVLLSMLKQQ